MYNSGNDNKMKEWFQKTRLTTWWASKDNYSKFCWFITLIWKIGQVWDLEYSLQCFGIKLSLMWECGHQFVDYKLGKRKVSEEIFWSDTCKGGIHELMYSGRIIYHRGRDEDDRLVSRDIRGWWITRGIFGALLG